MLPAAHRARGSPHPLHQPLMIFPQRAELQVVTVRQRQIHHASHEERCRAQFQFRRARNGRGSALLAAGARTAGEQCHNMRSGKPFIASCDAVLCNIASCAAVLCVAAPAAIGGRAAASPGCGAAIALASGRHGGEGAWHRVNDDETHCCWHRIGSVLAVLGRFDSIRFRTDSSRCSSHGSNGRSCIAGSGGSRQRLRLLFG